MMRTTERSVRSDERIKVLVVDDSAVVRRALGALFAEDPELDVLPAAADAVIALVRMQKSWPDVIVLDVELPHGGGLELLRRVMRERPTPIVISSSPSEAGATATLEALAAGAVSVVTKPEDGVKQFLAEAKDEIVSAVKTAARANVRDPRPAVQRPREKANADVILPPPPASAARVTTEHVVAIGTSAGGTQALEEVLTSLPASAPGIVVVQHMPERFTAAFAARLDKLCHIRVKEAAHDDPVLPGRALIAPGGRHLLLVRRGRRYFVEVVDGPVVSRHRPSVDVLFRSVARAAGPNALGVIMTGMGDDGAAGLLEMRRAGARTLAQNERTCLVYGMPKAAVKRGGVERSVPLDVIGREILKELSQGPAIDDPLLGDP